MPLDSAAHRTRPPDFREQLRRTYQAGNHVNLRGLVSAHGLESSDDGGEGLADLIDADARLRLERGLEVTLDRYLEAVPLLPRYRSAFDTAIEMSLRSLSGSDRPGEAAVQQLCARYPQFRAAIQTAGVLSSILCSTQGIRSTLTLGERVLPEDFGPPLKDGRPRYELRELIGHGAHGAVFLASDRLLSDRDRPAWVAIKILRNDPAHAQHPEGRIEKREFAVGDVPCALSDEATKARRVDHINIVRVWDRGIAITGEQYLVYEYIRGGDLFKYVNAQPAEIEQKAAAEMVAALASGLQAAHAAGLAHCDLKPGNILMAERGIPKITDFGIAVRVGAGSGGGGPEQRGEAYPRLGNLAFTAPEQYRGEAGASAPLADIYALGGILYWLLTRQYPNGSSAEEVDRNLRGVAGGAGAGGPRLEPPDPRTVRPVDRDLAAICCRALHPSVQQRYQSAEAMAGDLQAWLRKEPLRWQHTGPLRRLALFTRREPLATAAALIGIAGLVGASGIGVYMHQQGQRRELAAALALAETQAAADRQRIRDALGNIDSMLSVIRNARAQEFVPILTALETMSSSVFFEAAPGDIWEPRAEVARRLLERAAASGRQDDVETMLWESVYGYWLIRLENLDEARNVLTQNLARWERLKPDDPWCDGVRALLACIAAKKALAAGDDRLPHLAEAALALDGLDLDQDGWKVGRLVMRLVATTRAEVYGVHGLNDPAKAAAARRELRKLE